MEEAESGDIPSRKRAREHFVETQQDCPEKKFKNFCCLTFRQELKGNDALKSLKKFISAVKSSNDIISDYLASGGSLQEILSLLDPTATGDLTTALPVFEALHLIFLRFQSSDSKYHSKCIETARTILHSYFLILKAMLSMNVKKQKKIALKVLTSIATLDSSFANEIMNAIALSPALIKDLIQPIPEKESVRKCFILFVLSFLVEGSSITIRNLLEKKGFLTSIITDLKFDEATTVNLTLSIFEEKILKNPKVPKTLKLKTFNTQIIKSLFDLYEWKGFQGIKQLTLKKVKAFKEVEINQSEKEMVVESIHSFLLLLCCSKKFGVAFYDKSMGTSEEMNNQLLCTVFESLSDPLKNKKISEVMLKVICSCPDLMRPLLLRLEPSFQPRDSRNWFQAMEFAQNLVKAVDATTKLKKETESVTTNKIIKVGKSLCTPVVLLKIVKLASQKSQSIGIRLCSFTLLSEIWNEMQRLYAAFQNVESDLKKAFHKHVHKLLPDAEDLLELWHTLCCIEFFESLPFTKEKKMLFLSAVLESLHMISVCQGGSVISPLSLASDLLSHIELLKGSISQSAFDAIQVKIVQFVEMDFQGLTSNMALFEKSLVVLLQSVDESSVSCLSKFLASLEVFKRNKVEADVWLLVFLSLPRDYRSSVADFLIESVRLLLKKGVEGEDNLKMDILDETEKYNDIIEEFPTPLLFNCIEIFKVYFSQSSKKSEKLQPIRYFLNDVIIHLQHFYTVNVYLYDLVKDIKALGKSVVNYLKIWKCNCIQPIDVDVFPCRLEFDLVSWLIKKDRSQNVRELIDVENTHLLKRYSLFTIVVAYLNNKIVSQNLSLKDVEKFSEALSLFVSSGPEDASDSVDLISLNVRNISVYQRHCLNSLLRNKYLLNKFDVFQENKRDLSHVTYLILKVLIEKNVIKNLNIKRKLLEPWKCKFLNQLKAKLKKSESIDGINNLEIILNFFEYSHTDVTEMIQLLMSVPELDLFVNTNASSTWIVILSKFIELYCQNEELNESFVRKLCLIFKYLRERNCSKMEKLDYCFLALLRKHPRHLLFIDDDLLNVILVSTNTTTTTSTLGKLLLNDPNKVKHFLHFIRENLKTLEEPQIIFPLVSTLIVSEDSFFNIIKLNRERCVWRISEINPTATPEIFSALEFIYKKFKKSIIQAVGGKKEEFISKNLIFTRELIKLFIEKKDVVKLKNEISKGQFEPDLLFEAVKKINSDEITENYVRGLLTLFCRILKKSENLGNVNWEKHCSIVSDVVQFNEEFSWGSVAGALEWKEFTKMVLGYCLTSMKHSSLLKILRVLIVAFYKSEKFEDSSLLFQMLISHSQFLRVMLSDSSLKTELVELFYCLIKKSPSEMSPKHIPILLASYNASLSPCDRTVLQILRFYEINKLGVSNYEPFVWGDSAVSHYSIGINSGLFLWQRFNMANVLDLLDSQRLERSLKEFPLLRTLEPNQNIDSDSNVYDPAFLLPLFVNLLSPGAIVFCLSFIYRGGLAYTVRALSSECKDVRLLASLVLTRFYNHLELTQKLKQKMVWMHFINLFRYGIEDLSAQPLPNVITMFFGRMTLELSSQPTEMFIPLQNFLLAKPYFAFDAVPEFFPLFHSSDMSNWKCRTWLLEVIRDGMKTDSDMKIMFHTMGLKVIFCYFFSQFCDTETKKIILEVVERMLRIDKSILLISEYGLLNWISAIEPGFFQVILHNLLNLLYTLTCVILKDIQSQKCKHSNFSYIIQILSVTAKLLPTLMHLKSVEDFKLYLKIVKECLKLFTQNIKTNWFKRHKSSVLDIVEAGVVILGENHNCDKFCKVPFYFREFDEDCSYEDLKNSVFLFNMLVNGNANDKNKKLQ